MGPSSVSSATVGRLPGYLQVLAVLVEDEVSTVSSDHLADQANVHPATLRRDLSSIGFGGTRGVGYDVKGLVHAISVTLGVNQDWPVVVVGAGNLGRALVNYGGLAERGFPVRAVCDNDAARVGGVCGHLKVSHVDNLAALVADRDITMGVIATSADAAQGVADRLVAAGVKSILNFTAHPVEVPDGVTTRRVDLATELQILSFYQQRGIAVADGAGVPLSADELT